jgi:TetR/AcrR family transcriptional regulator, transcriptional repressor for nem operon
VEGVRPSTADRILDSAERLVQTRGFNGFSYADIAAELRVTKASLHYHFPTKAKLGVRLIARYTETFDEALRAIDDAGPLPRQRLEGYVALYENVLKKNRMCLCGMLAADHATLPKEMRERLKSFFDTNETWLARVLDEGRTQKLLAFPGPAHEEARLLLGALEGAMLVARSYSDSARFSSAAARLLANLDMPRRRHAPS